MSNGADESGTIPRTVPDWSHAPTPEPYDPLHKTNLGKSVENALLASPRTPLDAVPPFFGAGIYALYFIGDGPLYGPLAGSETPIYVGKAIPSGGRKGAKSPSTAVGHPLWDRIDEHRQSIKAARDLDIADFEARYLVADELFISMAEHLMIEGFAPVWNLRVDGFGNHDPGAGRRQQARSPWDELHPGRGFAALLTNPSKMPAEKARAVIVDHFRAFPPVYTVVTALPPPVVSADTAESASEDP
jgi:Eco29kI restriction endonuclease